MSTIDDTLRANQEYAKAFKLGNLPMPPGKHLAVLACMDARVTVEEILGLKTGDAHIIRNAGGIVTPDAIRSLIISHHLLNTKEFMVINHTDCGMLTFKDHELKQKLGFQTGQGAAIPEYFHDFTNLDENVKLQIQRIKSHPWLPDTIPVRGFVFNVKTGALREVK